MKCSRFRNLLGDYLYGDLSGKGERAFLRHGRSCPRCGPLLREMEETVRFLRRETPPRFSAAEMALLQRRVRERISQEKVQPHPAARRSLLFISPATVRIAASIVLAVTGVFIYTRFLSPPEEVPPEVGELVEISKTIESEDAEVDEICREIKQLQALFPGRGKSDSEAVLYLQRRQA